MDAQSNQEQSHQENDRGSPEGLPAAVANLETATTGTAQTLVA